MRRMKIRPTCRRPFDLIFARAKNGAWRAQRVSKARAECGHTDNHYFADSLTNVANLRAVVAHVLQRTHLSKVNLVGWSAGGPVIGMYAAEPANAATVDRMVFLSPLSVLPQTMPGPESQPKWSLGISTIDLTKGLFFLPPDPATCPGQVPDGQVEAIWAKQVERDPLGATWVAAIG